MIRYEQTVDGSLFVAAKDIRINGVVKGNLYTASQNLIVTGTVEGNMHCAAQNMLYSAGRLIMESAREGGTLQALLYITEVQTFSSR